MVQLITSTNGEIVDNGCENRSNLKEWFFDWEDFPLAQKYHLYVEHSGAQNPAIDETNIQNSEYLNSDYAYIVPNYANGWTWKVRAFVNGEWTE